MGRPQQWSILLWTATVITGHALIQHIVWICQELSLKPSKRMFVMGTNLGRMLGRYQQLSRKIFCRHFCSNRDMWPWYCQRSTVWCCKGGFLCARIHAHLHTFLTLFSYILNHRYILNHAYVMFVSSCRMSHHTLLRSSYLVCWMNASWPRAGPRILRRMTQHHETLKTTQMGPIPFPSFLIYSNITCRVCVSVGWIVVLTFA